MVLSVILFFLCIVVASASISVPLLAINNSYVNCFSVVFLCAVLLWLWIDNMLIAQDVLQLMRLRTQLQDTEHTVRTLKFENTMLQQEVAFLRLHACAVRDEEWRRRHVMKRIKRVTSSYLET